MKKKEFIKLSTKLNKGFSRDIIMFKTKKDTFRRCMVEYIAITRKRYEIPTTGWTFTWELLAEKEEEVFNDIVFKLIIYKAYNGLKKTPLSWAELSKYTNLTLNELKSSYLGLNEIYLSLRESDLFLTPICISTEIVNERDKVNGIITKNQWYNFEVDPDFVEACIGVMTQMYLE